MSSRPYLLDSSVFIQAARQYYAFDLAPAYWNGLIMYAKKGRVQSIDRVKEELEKGKDDLTSWAQQHDDAIFVSTDDEAIVHAYARVISWVGSQSQFRSEAIDDFARGADGWLVAVAVQEDLTVVTQEVLSAEVKRRVPIPNVCQAFNVEYSDTFDMLRGLGFQFDGSVEAKAS